MTHLLRSLIREALLLEEVYGAQAVVYHGTKADPQKLISALLNDEFRPGEGAGSMYGKGLYTVYDPEGAKTMTGSYGNHVIKLKVNLYGYIIFDPDVALKVYKKPLTPAQQAEEVGYSETVIETLKKVRPQLRNVFTSESALSVYESLQYEVKGLVFTGRNDGKVVVVYDPTTAVPMAWKRVAQTLVGGGQRTFSEPWKPVNRAALLSPLDRPDVSAREGRPAQQSALRRSATGSFEARKWDPSKILKSLERLPEDQRIVKGNLNLSYTSVATLPAGIRVDGDLILDHTPITLLPSGLQVGGNLILIGTSITSLPSGLKVGGNIDLTNTSITTLPVDLKVGGILFLAGVSITSLPAGMKVDGTLYFHNASITALPADLDVRGGLYLSGIPITELPAGLQVGKSIDISNTKITSLPADLKVGGRIMGFTGDKSKAPEHLKGKLL